jgi:hypothetical protein
MTTSHRPTFNAALGGASRAGVFSRQVSAKDQLGYTQLKFRAIGQHSQEEMLERDMRNDLNVKESKYVNDKKKALQLIEDEEKTIDIDKVALLLTNSTTPGSQRKVYADDDIAELEEDDDGFSSR